MRIAKMMTADICNGIGWGVSIWLTGCSLHCPGCFNSSLWDENAGKEFTIEEKDKLFKQLALPYIDHMSILGRRTN